MAGQEQKKPGSGFSSLPKSETPVTSGQSEVPNVKATLDKLEAAGKVKVIHGANDDEFEIAGAKVSQVRANLVDAFNIPGDALAFVNGDQVEPDYTLKQNDTLEFVKQAGVKGAYTC